jgi:hypothetical protein
LRVRVEACLLSQGIDLGIWGFCLGHGTPGTVGRGV